MATTSEHRLNTGLLVIRLGIAASLLIFALPRLIDGRRAWALVGKEIPFFSAAFPDIVVGGTILAIEVLASVGLLTGYLFRFSTALLATVYAVYFFNFINSGYKTLALYVGTLACVCIGLLLSGPGRFAVAVKIESKELN
ncbi:MAG: hypothetical protein WAU91_20140 [Desulfatitalea sp.]